MDTDELSEIYRVAADIQTFSALSRELDARRMTLEAGILAASTAVEHRAVLLGRHGVALAKVLPITSADGGLLQLLLHRSVLPPRDVLAEAVTPQFLREMAEAIKSVERPLRSVFATGGYREARTRAIEYLAWLRAWHRDNQIGLRVEGLKAALSAVTRPLSEFGDLLSPRLGLVQLFGSRGVASLLMDQSACRDLASAVAEVRQWAGLVRSAREASRGAGVAAREADLCRVLPRGSCPVASGSVLWLEASSGSWSGSLGRPILRIDVVGRPAEATALLRRLACWDALARLEPTSRDQEALTQVSGLGSALESAMAAVVVPAGVDASTEWARLVDGVVRRRGLLAGAVALARPGTEFDLWADFCERQEVYGRLLGELGFEVWFDQTGTPPLVLDQSACASISAAMQAVAGAPGLMERARKGAREAGKAVRGGEVDRILRDMPVARLKEASGGRIRVAPILDAGIRTVGEVLEWEGELKYLPGLGESSAARAVSAARSIWQATFEETPIRVDVVARSPEATHLLTRLAFWDAIRKAQPTADDEVALNTLGPIRELLAAAQAAVVAPKQAASAERFKEAAELLLARSAALLGREGDDPTHHGGDAWKDFLARPADYFTMLAELGFAVEDEAKVHGDLPAEIVDAIRQQELRTDQLHASLRGYQAFAARFAIVQRKVIIGDEMGLGKTIEALAVLAHLRAAGNHHFLVVCPAAVVTNWVRETATKSALRPYRLHGPGRDQEVRGWVRNGGVAITTFDSLGWFADRSDAISPACVVVDEAHYVKNPQTLRSQRAVALIEESPRALLLTGTPLENRVEEFRNLASYVRPDLLVDAPDFAPKRFRRQIAPAYLRRNQEDVLAELPELVEVEEWLPLSADDRVAYGRAVVDGNFMAMRQAALLAGRASQKVQRLLEIVDEAEANGRRVIVFSYFREVLSRLAQLVPTPVFGPVTGSVPAPARQAVVDAFSGAVGGAVLLAQVVAGGQGLNIQAASVVVICEPQLKPTLETQAIARAHRMGQVRSVQVHRLLSEEGADRRIKEILTEKQRLFDEFARDSDMGLAAPEALDVTDAELARRVIDEERERLAKEQRK